MNAKKKALKALVILVAVLALSMFFAKTVQTITTAKVQRVQATRGRLEDKIEVKGEIHFTEAEPFTVEDARKLNITVEKVLAKPGYLIKEGDALFTASVPTFDEEVEKIKADYNKKVRELTVEVAGHIRLPQSSEHNAYYNQMLTTTDAYYEKLYAAQAAAVEADYDLPEDVGTWGKPVKAAEQTQEPQKRDEQAGSGAPESPAPEEAAPTGSAQPSAEPTPTVDPAIVRKEALMKRVREAMQAAYEAKIAMDGATDTLRRIYQGTGPVPRVGDGIYDYLKKTDGMREDIAKFKEQMLELSRLKAGLQRITAPRGGWLMSMDVKAGDKYEGAKAAYSLSLPGELPVLRCDVTDVKKPLQKGMKVKVQGSDLELSISEVTIAADGKKFAIIQLDEASIQELGGLSKLMSGQQDVTITYKASRTTTLIPASALRTEGTENYVYLIQQSYGGMLSNTTYTVKKQTVNVIETSQKLVSLEDDLSYQEIADREDRSLSDGQAVMEYVD